MRATVKIAYEFDEIDVKNLMLQKGYDCDNFTEEDLAYELSRLNLKELQVFGFYDTDDKEITIEQF